MLVKIKQIHNCKLCNTPFSCVGNRRYCSNQCFKKQRLNNARSYRYGKGVCVYCNKVFDKKTKHTRFCCITCGVRNRKSIKQLVKCITCNKEFMDYPFNIKRSKQRFCSNKCYGLSRKGKRPHNFNQTGHKSSYETRRKQSVAHKKRVALGLNHFWKGGISPINKRIRYSIDYKIWRTQVFSRDNWTCQTCGIRGIELNAHHIKSFSKFPDLRFSVENGITLCKPCHELTDNYGWKERWGPK